MTKNRFFAVLALAVLVALCLSLVACDNSGDDNDHKHVYVGKAVDDATHTLTCVCGSQVVRDHEFDEWKVTTDPTTTTQGVKISACTGCNYEKTVVIPTLLDGEQTLEMYAVNDFHGKWERIAQFGDFLKSKKAANPNTLVLNSGDMFQGSMQSNSNYGRMLTDCMTEIGFDAFTYGNHEFDWGIEKMLELQKTTEIPFLGANIYKWDPETRQFGEFADDIAKEYAVTTLPNGLKVGIIGVIGSQQITSICSDRVQNIGFKDPKEIIPQVSDKLRNQLGCHVVVVCLHAQASTLDKMEMDDYVDAVFCAHSHDFEKGFYSYGTPYVQSGSYGQALSCIKLSVTSDGTVSCQNYDHCVYDDDWASDSAVSAIVDDYVAKLPISPEQLVCTSDGTLNKNAGVPRLACRAIADFAVNNGHDDIVVAMCNVARYSMPSGKVTYSDLYECLPFDNTVYIAEITGTNLISLAKNNSFWRVSGEKIVNDNQHVYKVAIIDYLLMHQNSSRQYDYTKTAFEAGRMTPVALTNADGSATNYREITIAYLAKNPTVSTADYSGKDFFTNASFLTEQVDIAATAQTTAFVAKGHNWAILPQTVSVDKNFAQDKHAA